MEEILKTHTKIVHTIYILCIQDFYVTQGEIFTTLKILMIF